MILSLLTQGETYAAILADYPDLELEDIRACLAYKHAVIIPHSLDAVGAPARHASLQIAGSGNGRKRK